MDLGRGRTCGALSGATLFGLILLGGLLPAAALFAPEPAAAGTLDAEVAVDLLHARSRANGSPSGRPANLHAEELGMRVRIDATEGGFSFRSDYHGREPLGGLLENSAIRLLYEAHASYQGEDQPWKLSLGRFIAPSVVFLPTDGLRAELKQGRAHWTLFGGRRAITTSRRNVDGGDYLASAGLSLVWSEPRLRGEAAVAFSGDEAVLTAATSERTDTWDAWNGYLRVFAWPGKKLRLGAQVSGAERAAYWLGPAWALSDVEVEAADLWNAVGYAEWRPCPGLRLGYEVHTQRAGVFRAGLLRRSGDDVVADPVLTQPEFTDNRVRGAWRILDSGWIRGEARHRSRPDREEVRLGLSVDIDRLSTEWLARDILGLDWLATRSMFARAAIARDDLNPRGGRTETPFLGDRRFWLASVGWERGGLEIEAGGSRLERRAGPHSGRRFDSQLPGQPVVAEDLSPFVIGVQSVAFVRGFYANRRWFTGLDLERNLEDRREIRVLVQAGVFLEESW